MIIQGLNNVASAYGATYKSVIGQQTSFEVSTSAVADKVSISAAGQALAKAESANQKFDPQSRLAFLSEAAHSMSESGADKIAREWAGASDGILVDPNMTVDEAVNHKGRLASTGQQLTPEDFEYFDNLSKQVQQEREKIYNTEKAKGTPAADIVDKMLAYSDSLPTKYQILAGYKVGTF